MPDRNNKSKMELVAFPILPRERGPSCSYCMWNLSDLSFSEPRALAFPPPPELLLAVTPPSRDVDDSFARYPSKPGCMSATPHTMRLETDASTARLSGRFQARRIAWVCGRGEGGRRLPLIR